ncbi:MAG: imidazole glycerol phosphate synthase subunit HisH [Pseudomonadota bacterium]
MKPLNVVIIDYDMSNLFSVKHLCDILGVTCEITNDKKKILNAGAVILPGVGAFSDAMGNLEKLDLVYSIHDFIQSGKSFMGVCLGLQLLFTQSDEFGCHKGLNIIPGVVKKFKTILENGEKVKVPHVGWNRLYQPKSNQNRWQKSPLKNFKENEFTYFVHSYYVQPKDDRHVLSLTNYEDQEFCSSIHADNIFATQFHPEKSGENGIKIFSEWLGQIKKSA